jgi:group II intron reverse transcriptase/maturase
VGKLLRQIISFDNLCRAWEEVTEEESEPGIDGMTVEAFARHWEANLRELQQAVRSNYYRPAPLVRFTIPKRDGSPRLLGNLTLRDKILQRAVLRVLDDIYERYFLDCSYAYRRGRSVQQAVEKLLEARSFGYTWVLDADIDDFFHSLDHHLLLRFLRETITDEPLLALIVAWLNIGRPETDWAVGTPLGAIISPLLSNIYLHYLDLVMTGGMDQWPGAAGPMPNWVYIRYADDFIVLCRRQAQAELALRLVDETLATLLLALEPSKTVITTFEQGFEYLGCYFQGEHFYFRYRDDWIKVDQSGDWRLFYQHGPQEYT